MHWQEKFERENKKTDLTNPIDEEMLDEKVPLNHDICKEVMNVLRRFSYFSLIVGISQYNYRETP